MPHQENVKQIYAESKALHTFERFKFEKGFAKAEMFAGMALAMQKFPRNNLPMVMRCTFAIFKVRKSGIELSRVINISRKRRDTRIYIIGCVLRL